MHNNPFKYLDDEKISALMTSNPDLKIIADCDADTLQEIECLALYGKSKTPEFGYEWHAKHITDGGFKVSEWTLLDVKRGIERVNR